MASMSTVAWRNWRAHLDQEAISESWESALYSESQFTGDLQLGPYQLLLTHGETTDLASPALVLRVDLHLYHAGVDPDMSHTDTSRYHGGSLDDEMAGLLSLAVRARLRSGGPTRSWWRGERDPRGTPIEFNHHRPYLPRPVRGETRLPGVNGTRSLKGAAELLGKFPTLKDTNAVALVRAARMYERAVWVADDDPNLAWLNLVGALEVAAGTIKYKTTMNKLDRVREADPKLAALLDQVPPEVADQIAAHTLPRIRAANRFIKFVTDHTPPPPAARSENWEQVDWDALDVMAAKIYDYRSRSLHSGEPFPAPMCDPPWPDHDNGSWQEAPLGNASHSQDSSWLAEDAPMLLSTFEYIAHGALLNWWKHLT
jgi:hypothetical protein